MGIQLGYMGESRVNLKVDASTRDQLRKHKRDGETWDGLLSRLAKRADSPDFRECERCGAVLSDWTEWEGDVYCGDCLDHVWDEDYLEGVEDND